MNRLHLSFSPFPPPAVELKMFALPFPFCVSMQEWMLTLWWFASKWETATLLSQSTQQEWQGDFFKMFFGADPSFPVLLFLEFYMTYHFWSRCLCLWRSVIHPWKVIICQTHNGCHKWFKCRNGILSFINVGLFFCLQCDSDDMRMLSSW